jgi:hypothetical protein
MFDPQAVHHDDTVLLASKPEIEYWTLRFNASESQIRRAIGAVGDHPARVSAWLRELQKSGSGFAGERVTGLFQTALRNTSFMVFGMFTALVLFN